MADLVLVNCDVYTSEVVHYTGGVRCRGATIAEVGPGVAPSGDDIEIDLGGLNVAPGFIDLQVNGGGDVLLNDLPSVESVARIVRAHRKFGTTGMLPTFITGSAEGMSAAAAATRQWRDEGGQGVLGFHLEGPFLNPKKAGVHDASLMRPLAKRDVAALPSPRKDEVALITVAPELAEPGAVAELASAGWFVWAGHTDALAAEIVRAESEGLRGCTHLFNAMRGLESREPGVVGAGLDLEALKVGVIADGFHVDYRTLRVAWRAKHIGGMVLVTDAMPPVGGSATEFRIGDYDVEVVNGRCQTDNGTLAGSALDMASAVRNIVRHVGVPRDEALRMASLYPAKAIGMADTLGRVEPGYNADLVVFDNELEVRGVVVAGEPSEGLTSSQ